MLCYGRSIEEIRSKIRRGESDPILVEAKKIAENKLCIRALQVTYVQRIIFSTALEKITRHQKMTAQSMHFWILYFLKPLYTNILKPSI